MTVCFYFIRFFYKVSASLKKFSDLNILFPKNKSANTYSLKMVCFIRIMQYLVSIPGTFTSDIHLKQVFFINAY